MLAKDEETENAKIIEEENEEDNKIKNKDLFVENVKIKIKIAKIDATKNKKIAHEYSVKSFPTIKYVYNGVMNDYTGMRTKERLNTFFKIMKGNAVTEITDMLEIRNLQKTNLISDSSPNNIIFLLTIFDAKEDMLGQKSAIEINFTKIAQKYKGKGIFVILKTEIKCENFCDFSSLDNVCSKNVFLDSGIRGPGSFFKISKIEFGREAIYMMNENNIKKNIKKNENGEISESDKSNRDVNAALNSQEIEGFFLSNNRPMISEFSQRNFKFLSELNKIMIILVVNNNEIEKRKYVIDEKEKNANVIDNNENGVEAVNGILSNLDDYVNTITSHSISHLNSDHNEILNLNDYVIGYLELEKWKRFLAQYQIKKSSFLIIDFRTPKLKYYTQTIDITEGKNSNENIYKQIEILFDNLAEKKIEFVQVKNSYEKIRDKLFTLKSKIQNAHAYSVFIVTVLIIFFISFLVPSPSLKKKK